ncbi:MAG: YitT family protein [Massilibacteroides sp.]|nr:YitT family protein [Massilibacteroides sp.]
MNIVKMFSRMYLSSKDFIIIFLGTMLYAFGFYGFILSNDIVNGGLSGICALIFFATGIKVSLSYFVLNLGLLFVAWRILGVKFVFRTAWGVICMSSSFTFMEWVLKGESILNGQPFMSVVIGAMICGASLGFIFSANGSTGGTDILGAIVNKYKNISIGRTLLYCDFVIVLSSYFIFHDVNKIVFGFVEMFICNIVLDNVLNSNRQSVQFLIISDKYDQIANRIIKDLGRGCTVLDATGGYSGHAVKVVMLVTKQAESVTVFRLIKSIDEKAFISQSIVRGVYGEGFDVIKT